VKQRFALAFVLVLSTTLAAQEKPLTLDPSLTVSMATIGSLSQVEWNDLRFAAEVPDLMRVCTDDAMTVCLTVGEIRALAHVAGELGPADQQRRELLSYQSLYVSTLGELDQCRGQLGPLRMQTNARAIEEQFTAWIAELEKRTGMVYDRQTGALVPRSPK
jgi:hypothetical protein